MAHLDENGLVFLWNKIKSYVGDTVGSTNKVIDVKKEFENICTIWHGAWPGSTSIAKDKFDELLTAFRNGAHLMFEGHLVIDIREFLGPTDNWADPNGQGGVIWKCYLHRPLELDGVYGTTLTLEPNYLYTIYTRLMTYVDDNPEYLQIESIVLEKV